VGRSSIIRRSEVYRPVHFAKHIESRRLNKNTACFRGKVFHGIFLSGSKGLLTYISEDDILYIVRRYIGG
jgi:hypothetical protein